MGLLIDTSVFVAHERGELQLPSEFGASKESVLLSVITASELLHGVHRGYARAIQAALPVRRSDP